MLFTNNNFMTRFVTKNFALVVVEICTFNFSFFLLFVQSTTILFALNMENNFGCDECNKTFKYRKNLYAHLRRFHDKDPLIPKETESVCEICGQQFVNNSNLYRHIKQMHEGAASNVEVLRKSRIVCPTLNCSEHFRTYENLRGHLLETHKIRIECSEFNFKAVTGMYLLKNMSFLN